MRLKNIRNEIDAILKPLGFERQAATWNRRAGGFIDVIDLQVSKSGDLATMNAGVLHPGVHTNMWGTDAPDFVAEPFSTVRIRVGQLLDGRELWWSLDALPTKADLRRLLDEHVLPFIESLHSVEAMERHLIRERVEEHPYPQPKIHLALLKYERGDKAGACALLSDMKSTMAEAWRSRVAEIAQRIGCAA